MLNFALLIWSKLRGQFINVEVWRMFCWLIFWEKDLKYIKSSHIHVFSVGLENTVCEDRETVVAIKTTKHSQSSLQRHTGYEWDTNSSFVVAHTRAWQQVWHYLVRIPSAQECRAQAITCPPARWVPETKWTPAASDQAPKGPTGHDCATGQRSSHLLGGLDMNVSGESSRIQSMKTIQCRHFFDNGTNEKSSLKIPAKSSWKEEIPLVPQVQILLS